MSTKNERQKEGKIEQLKAVDPDEQKKRIENLSQEMFGKPSKDIKYLLLTNYVHKQLLEEEITRTGLYQWINVFKGKVKYPREIMDYNDYDIIHINMSAQDVHLAADVKEKIRKDSKTKVVLNNDYTTEMWGRSFDYPSTVGREAKYADMLFGTEYYQTTALAELTGRKVFIVPHPCDIRRLKALVPMRNKEIISTIWRRYDNHFYVPSLAVRNHGLTTQLIGYDKKGDPKTHLTTTMYDYVYSGTNYFDFCSQLRESKIVYDPFTFHSYSRATVDTAAMGVAVVGTNRTQSMQICYPHTLVDPYDVHTSRKLIRRLINDKEFYDKVITTAKKNCEFYNHTNSKERFLLSLNEALKGDGKGEEVVEKKATEIGRGDDVLGEIASGKNRPSKRKNDTK